MNLSNADDGDRGDIDEGDDCDSSHLDDIEDGCGCVEVWEALSEQRHASD